MSTSNLDDAAIKGLEGLLHPSSAETTNHHDDVDSNGPILPT